MRARSTALVGFLLVGALIAAACSSSDDPSATDPSTSDALSIEALSTRPEYVTGGDVLVGISAPEAATLDEVVVTVDDRDVTEAFELDEGQLVGLVDSLPEGGATIEATVGDDTVELAVTNYPTTGPLFSGPHQEPFLCTTEAAGLGPATDEDCSAPTKSATQDLGEGVMATVEQGVIDRSVYTIAVPESGWNGRLVYRYGGGCGTSYSQGSGMVSALDPSLVGAGYAVATSSLNTFQVNCNEVLSAEVTMMVKEHFIETFGLPEFTIGEGGSGGAIQQLSIAQNYPGLLDALAPTVPFPDALSISPGVTDCGLLTAYYASPEGSALADAQRVAINGHRTAGTCALWDRSFVPVVDATKGCSPQLPAAEIFDPVTNPDGVRCTLQDSAINIAGQDPETGFGLRPLDNVGVQYGLEALESGAITAEEFVTLNERIGGYDINGKIVSDRTEVDAEVMERPYATGRVLSDAEGMSQLPIILVNVYTDDQGDIHDRQRVFVIRDRLSTGADSDKNLVIWTWPGSGDLMDTLLGAVGNTASAVEVLDAWLTAAAADEAPGTWAEKLARNRTAEAIDTCITPDQQSTTGDGIYDEDNACTQAYPVASDPRRVAGASLRNDIMKCALTPLDPDSYGTTFDAAQIDRLEAVFPDGVCDYSQPGVGQVPLSGTWLTYG